MRTELPADRLQRRLERRNHDNDDDDDEDDESGALLSRWLPQTPTPAGQNWWNSVRADPGRAGGAALAAVAVIAVLVTIFTLMKAEAPPVQAVNLPAVEMVSASASPSGTAQAQDMSVVVSVVGLVHTPGLVTLPAGSRVADALAAAGGPLDGADLLGLNIAERVTDGQQIVIGLAPPPGQPATLGSSVSSGQQGGDPAPSAPGAAPAAKVDLNSATVEQLDELPGVGPVTAAAIVAWRDSNGPFTSVDQLSEVDGIGPARLDKLRDQVLV